MLKLPSLVVVVLRERLVAWFVAVTVAPGIPAAVASRTMPLIWPEDWEYAGMPCRTAVIATNIRNRLRTETIDASSLEAVARSCPGYVLRVLRSGTWVCQASPDQGAPIEARFPDGGGNLVTGVLV